jgi:hypothetical protein
MQINERCLFNSKICLNKSWQTNGLKKLSTTKENDRVDKGSRYKRLTAVEAKGSFAIKK